MSPIGEIDIVRTDYEGRVEEIKSSVIPEPVEEPAIGLVCVKFITVNPNTQS